MGCLGLNGRTSYCSCLDVPLFPRSSRCPEGFPGSCFEGLEEQRGCLLFIHLVDDLVLYIQIHSLRSREGWGQSRSRTIAPGLWPLGIEPRTIQLGVATTHPAPHINIVPYLCQHVTCRNTSQQANHSVHGQRWRGRSVLISRSRWLSQITQRAHCSDSIFNSSLVCVVHCSYSIVT